MFLGDIIVANFIGEKGAIDRAGTYAIFKVMPTKCSPLSPLEGVTRKILPYPVSGAFAMLNSLQCSASQGLLPTNPFYLPVSKNSRCNSLSLCVRQRDDWRRAAQPYRGSNTNSELPERSQQQLAHGSSCPSSQKQRQRKVVYTSQQPPEQIWGTGAPSLNPLS